MLEKLVHYSGDPPANQHYIEVTLPKGGTYEVLNSQALPGWNLRDVAVARAFGAAWYTEQRSLVLIVPSVVAPMEHNYVINCDHEEFQHLKTGLETPVYWDERLFER